MNSTKLRENYPQNRGWFSPLPWRTIKGLQVKERQCAVNKEKQPEAGSYRRVILNPPDDVCGMVGRIMAHWSFQVWLLQQCTYTLLGVGDKQGRLAVRDPRPDEHVKMIQDLMKLAGFETKLKLSELMEDLRTLKGLRDNIAHGVWTQNMETGRLTLSIDSGIWVPHKKSEKVSRRVVPEARGIDAEGLESVRDGIEGTILITQKLLVSLEKQVLALNGKYPPPRPLGRRIDDPKSGTQQPQQPTSLS